MEDSEKLDEVDEMLQALDKELPESLDDKHEKANDLLEEIHEQIQFLHDVHSRMNDKE
jgi:ElaB/YqjD/DUF883 family membrane-anchored ribosome-binding protein